mmetsp:Transcript_111946/g.321643  ORF Transcript_111946/g.321643 Transcript_111946/m.321643 type:complete len:233 (+) Transcript_111946:217-915(+)
MQACGTSTTAPNSRPRRTSRGPQSRRQQATRCRRGPKGKRLPATTSRRGGGLGRRTSRARAASRHQSSVTPCVTVSRRSRWLRSGPRHAATAIVRRQRRHAEPRHATERLPRHPHAWDSERRPRAEAARPPDNDRLRARSSRTSRPTVRATRSRARGTDNAHSGPIAPAAATAARPASVPVGWLRARRGRLSTGGTAARERARAAQNVPRRRPSSRPASPCTSPSGMVAAEC